jgi:hypothetical protein
MRVFKAIVLVDEPGDARKHYATLVENQVKTIETRMKNMVPEGDIVICCGSKSMTANRGKALCIVTVGKGRPMTDDDAADACIESVPGRWAFPLSNWRFFSRKFEFTKRYIEGSYQSIFTISIPDDIQIL